MVDLDPARRGIAAGHGAPAVTGEHGAALGGGGEADRPAVIERDAQRVDHDGVPVGIADEAADGPVLHRHAGGGGDVGERIGGLGDQDDVGAPGLGGMSVDGAAAPAQLDQRPGPQDVARWQGQVGEVLLLVADLVGQLVGGGLDRGDDLGGVEAGEGGGQVDGAVQRRREAQRGGIVLGRWPPSASSRSATAVWASQAAVRRPWVATVASRACSSPRRRASAASRTRRSESMAATSSMSSTSVAPTGSSASAARTASTSDVSADRADAAPRVDERSTASTMAPS